MIYYSSRGARQVLLQPYTLLGSTDEEPEHVQAQPTPHLVIGTSVDAALLCQAR